MSLFLVALDNEKMRAAVKRRPETNIRSLMTEFKVVSSIVGRHLARMGKLKYTKDARCKKLTLSQLDKFDSTVNTPKFIITGFEYPGSVLLIF